MKSSLDSRIINPQLSSLPSSLNYFRVPSQETPSVLSQQDWDPRYIASGRPQQKTFPKNFYTVIEVFTSPLHRNGSSSIVACVFLSTGTCLPSRCLAMNVYSDSALPTLESCHNMKYKSLISSWLAQQYSPGLVFEWSSVWKSDWTSSIHIKVPPVFLSLSIEILSRLQNDRFFLNHFQMFIHRSSYCHVLRTCVTYKTGFGFNDRIHWTFTQLVTTFKKSRSSTGHFGLLTTLR
jgi:hypothetical protein